LSQARIGLSGFFKYDHKVRELQHYCPFPARKALNACVINLVISFTFEDNGRVGILSTGLQPSGGQNQFDLRAYPKSNFMVVGACEARTNHHIPF
jgi:hypothetical protein